MAVAVLMEWKVLVGGTVVGMDAATLFYPAYAFLGESLSSLRLPVWNPYQVSGTPFAADPQSGWMYWPAMVLFSALPLAAAAKSFIFLHLLVAALAVYALARCLGIAVFGALFSAISYGFATFFYERSLCCFEHVMVAAWLPVVILAVEMALRQAKWLTRGLWWCAAGFAFSQILASWLGQGSYYALLAVVGHLLYRTLLSPPSKQATQSGRARVRRLALHGAAVLMIGAGMAAAGLLPRIEYNVLSNLAGGYADTPAAIAGGWTPRDWAKLLDRRNWYGGAGTLALALVTPFVARGRYGTPFWFALSLGALLLAGRNSTPLHWLLYQVLPGFSRLHPHNPERIMMLFYLGTSLCAGATITSLRERGKKAALIALIPAAGAVALKIVETRLPEPAPRLIPIGTLIVLLLAVLFLAVYPLLNRYRGHASALVLVVLVIDLFTAGRTAVDNGPGRFRTVDLNSHYDATGAASFLRTTSGRELFRYFGYDPEVRLYEPRTMGYPPTTYRYHWRDIARGAVMLVHNRSVPLHLQDIQGYRPVRIKRYDEFMFALNGREQEYRESNILVGGLESPLLDLLNVRYIVVPRATVNHRNDLQSLAQSFPAVYTDPSVRVLHRPQTLPRAWLVHQAQQVQRGDALELLSSGAVNPRRVALLETPPPPLAEPTDPTADRATVTSFEPGRIRASTTSSAASLLVFSEVYYPAWKAYVDGESVPLYVADHALRAVPVPAGPHTVEMRYESTSLRLGITISLLSYLVVMAVGVTEVYSRSYALREASSG
ncbi:MAG: YfhO family protein [Chloroflexota bacterium]|nr:YfhO family protein [Chloroflexota bacterium]